MKNVSQLFKDYFYLRSGYTLADKPLDEMTIPLDEATFPLYAGDKKLEYKVIVGGLEYYGNAIYSVKIDNSLCEGNKFSIGNANSAKLIVSLLVGTETIPKMANVQVYVRYNGASGATEWVRYGSYFIDERAKKSNKLILTCYDSMLKAEKPFIQSETIPDFPMPQIEALNIICNRLGLILDNVGINPTYTIEYTNENSMRQVLMDIACSNCGNFTIVNDTLKLIKPSNSVGEKFSYAGFEDINDSLQFSRVTMYYTDEDYYTAGDDTKEELVLRNDNATQAMCNAVLASLSGYIHKPFKCRSAYLNPIYELGDPIQINDVNYQMWSYSLTFGANIKYNISSPGESAIEHEYPYEGQYSREIKQRVQLNKPYFGVKINRTEGLRIEKSDGSSEAIFNSEILAMRALKNGIMTDQIFFDSLAGKFKITADVDIAAVNAINGDIASLQLTTQGLTTRIQNAEGDIASLELTTGNFSVRLDSAEGDIASLELTTSGLKLSVDNVKTVFDSTGLTIKNGGFKIKNSADVDVFGVDVGGNMTLAGNLYNTALNKTVRLYNGKLEIGSGNSAGGNTAWMQNIVGTIYGDYYQLAPLPSEESLILLASKSLYMRSSWYSSISWGMGSAGHVFNGRVQLNNDIYMNTSRGMRSFTPKRLTDTPSGDFVLSATW